MSTILVKKSGSLRGEVEVSGSKNAVLPLLAATLLTDEACEIADVPDLKDVDVMSKLLMSFGAVVEEDKGAKTVKVCAKTITSNEAPCPLVKKMRASVLAMGPLLARTGRAKVPLPGGCAIGKRPIDLHLKGFRTLGANIESTEDELNYGYVEAVAAKLTGGEIYLDTRSVGATENIMMAAALAEGMTLIENAAQEPEIVDLANFLNKMGAKIKGAGTDMIKIEGVKRLHGAKHTVIPDRIEAGTFMLAAAITNGDITITNTLSNHVKPVIAKLRECGVSVDDTANGIRVRAGRKFLTATDIKTLPYPGFPTDIQPQFMTFLATASGPSVIWETVFENRFMHVKELNKMNAGITIPEGRKAIVPGGRSLKGAKVRATDLRAGAALILAGLTAAGETEISDIYHIDRGYAKIIEKFSSLGADITRTV
ncbi:MAG: UDP-N-acetylglucosamine 1-carboxyvinyltransferase [Clostridiales Family XIII bacterium]|nr:UDP-N-acetylglucosamine 1-carboxyvinyltransferase [Clostridiales Family XIII bacterium]